MEKTAKLSPSTCQGNHRKAEIASRRAFDGGSGADYNFSHVVRSTVDWGSHGQGRADIFAAVPNR
jgi:hypothetical protein